MVRIPPINNQQTANRKLFNVLQQVGITILLDLFEEKKEAYFLDIEQGANPLGAFAFRIANGNNDFINYFTEQPLAMTPTVQDVIDNPLAHFQRLVIGTNVDVRRAVAEAPERESEIMTGLQRRREAGETLAQVVANAVNADKDVRRQFDTYLINARDFAQDTLRSVTSSVVGGLDENLARLVSGLSDFVLDGAFARPRRSGDGKRVSKQQHEYNYLSTEIIESYGTDILGTHHSDGFTHLDVALHLLFTNFERPRNNVTGLGPTDEARTTLEDESEKSIIEEQNFVIPVELFAPSAFSYGNFIDSYHMRRLLAELKKIVQESRVDNITEFLRQNGQTRQEYIADRIGRLAPNGFISLAANEFIINTCLQPTRPVRAYVARHNLVEATFRGDDEAVNEVGPLLVFAAGRDSGPAGL